MGIQEVADIINSIATGFKSACLDCMKANQGIFLDSVKEQLYSGLNGEGKHLSPTYDDDPYFDLPGRWHNRGKAYKEWKLAITPPVRGVMLGLPSRPDAVPNLFINGMFYSEITIGRKDEGLEIDPGDGKGPDIVGKYGDNILSPGNEAIEYFNRNFMIPAIEKFLKDCGYR